MRPALRDVSSPDIDLPALYDVDLDLDAALLELIIGPADADGEESFGVVLVTAAHLAAMATVMPVVGRHYLVMERINVRGAVGALMHIISDLDEPSWPELAIKIARLGAWEFEDHHPWAPSAEA